MNVSKLKIILSVALSGIVIGVCAIFGFTAKDNMMSTMADPEYKIEMTQKDFKDFKGDTFTSGKKFFRYTEFAFENVSANDNNELILNRNGKNSVIYNTLEDKSRKNFSITGINTIQIDYTCDENLLVYLGDTPNPLTSKNKGFIESGIVADVSDYSENKYISIKTFNSSAIISRIIITYTCIPLPSPTPTNKCIGLDVIHPSEYKYGDKINFEKDFIVNAMYSNGNKEKLSYSGNGTTGWYFQDILEDDEIIANFPKTFTKLSNYIFIIGCDQLNADYYGEFNVKGGTEFTATPDILEVTPTRLTYNVNETFDSKYLDVQGTWHDYGGKEKVNLGDGTNGYKLVCETHDLATPFIDQGQYPIELSYRNKTYKFEVSVMPMIEKSNVFYDYNEYGKHNYSTQDIMPTRGNSRVLVIPVWLKDSNLFIKTQQEKNEILNDIEIAYFGTKEQTGWHSVQSYYYQDSYGKLNITGKVSKSWYEAPFSHSQITTETTQKIAKLASIWYKSQITQEEWNSYDSDKDGFIDCISLIYGCPNRKNIKNDSDSNSDLWAYCFWVGDLKLQNVNDPGVNTYFWASYDFMDIGCNRSGVPTQSKDNPVKIDTHTYIHEMGHVLGLEDYYDYADASINNRPAGDFSMQDANVGGHDAYSKFAYGWVQPYVPTESTLITLNDFDSTGDCILLTPKYNNSAFDEYILLEYFTPTGLNELDTTYQYKNSYPQGTKESGLRVWHVDARMFGWIVNNNTLMPDNNYYTAFENQPGLRGCYLATSNTTNTKDNVRNYVREQDFRFDQLALLNQSYTKKEPYSFNEGFGATHLWQLGDSFDMETYQGQFPNNTLLDSGQKLGFSFKVVGQTPETISVQITKIM